MIGERMVIKNFHIERVVTRDIASDIFNSIRNFFGLRLRNYETRLRKTIEEMNLEMNLKYEVKWYRMIVNPLVSGSAMIILYGEGEEHE